MKFFYDLIKITIQDGIYPPFINENIDRLLSSTKHNKIRWERWLDTPVLNNDLLLEKGAAITGDLNIEGHLNVDTLEIDNETTVNDLDVKEELKVNGGSPLEMAYPVGSIYMSARSENPANENILGFGVWEEYSEGKVLVGDDPNDNDFNGNTNTQGGEKEVQLTEAEMATHEHNTILTGSSSSHRHDYTQITGRTTTTGGWFGYNALLGSARRTIDTDPPDVSGDHSHEINTEETGGDQPHNNLQPYTVVRMWKRVQ